MAYECSIIPKNSILNKMEYNQDDLRFRFVEFCEKNGIESFYSVSAWEEYDRVCKDFVLQGDSYSWLLVSLLIILKKNGTNLSKFIEYLNFAHIEVIDLLVKLSKWIHMCQLDNNTKEFADKLILNHSTCSRLFHGFIEKYSIIFILPKTFSSVDTSYNKRKQRKKLCTENEIFHFIWLFFIYSKIRLHNLSSDMVSLLHLLICIFQLVLSSITQNKQYGWKFINENFKNQINPNATENSKINFDNMSQILFFHESESFHQSYNILKDGIWRRFLYDLTAHGILRLSDNLSEFFEPDNFSHNLNKLDTFYSDHFHDFDIFDERNFLYSLTSNDFNSFNSIQLKVFLNSFSNMSDETNDTTTPIISPLKQKTLVSQLCRIFVNFSHFSTKLKSFSVELQPEVITRFSENALLIVSSQPNNPIHNSNFDIISGIYYNLVLSVFRGEKVRCSSSKFIDLFNSTIFNNCLIACSIEIFLFLFNEKSLLFPWIQNVFNIDCFCFFRVIEVIIRSDIDLSRDVIKYLNEIEEYIVTHLAWNEGSSLYSAILKNNGIPGLSQIQPLFLENDPSFLHDIPTNPTPVSAATLFLDSTRRKKLATVTRNLFPTPSESHEVSQTLMDFHFRITKSEDNIPLGVVVSRQPNTRSLLKSQEANCSSEQSTDSSASPLSRGLSPLVLFMRKLYRIATIRLNSLCEFLQIENKLRGRYWTTFEYVMINHHNFLKDHHLDQIIMCCIYAVGRSMGSNWSFNEILKWYRLQSHSLPEIYRKVKLTPLLTSPPSNNIEYGDLIIYYNKVFLTPLNKYFYENFNSTNHDYSITTSLPRFKSFEKFSPHKLATVLPVYVSPKKSNIELNVETLYRFPESPMSENLLSLNNSPNLLGVKRKTQSFDRDSDISSLICHSPFKIPKT